MSQYIWKIFSLRDIKYSWVLLSSSILFGITNFIDRLYSDDPLWILISYWISFSIAVLWGALNYISHIRLNSMYKKQDDIRLYVNQLAMSQEDKLELQTYLEDYVQDLIQQGNSEEEAIRDAINQFKVKEFLSLSKNTMFFNLHAHYYLFGWMMVSIVAAILVWVLEATILPYPSMMLTIESIFIVYAIGLFGMFFLYKIIDVTIYKKFHDIF
ncbi:permease prefix domain 1-containing protein [Lederbergia graminis]|uniref:Permease prefix domain 1-containing protein n=1 Tax=Lederbergia graminis TaxID=735518 RepID=A0ABW0LL76_9BACI